MAIKIKKTDPNQGKTEEGFDWPYGPKNYLIFGIAMAVIIIGYIALGMGSITLAPILLVVGYCVLIPISLLVKGTPEEKKAVESDPAS